MTVHVGEPIARREDLRLLTGAGYYVDDVHLDGTLHASLYRSTWPHARIRSVDISGAAAVPGVVGVFTYADFSDVLKPIRPRIAAIPHFDDFLQLPLSGDKVRYVGEPIAVVVAIDPYIAEDAASLISAEVESLPPILNWQAASGRSLLIHEDAGPQIDPGWQFAGGIPQDHPVELRGLWKGYRSLEVAGAGCRSQRRLTNGGQHHLAFAL